MIAGTYTPFTLLALGGAIDCWLFGAVGTLALVGMTLDAIPRKGRRLPPLVIYLGMGWLVLFALEPLIATLPSAGF